MQKSFITTVDGWRFERPLAIALAASAMFMVAAVPRDRLAMVPALAAFPALQPVLALLVGVALGVAGYRAMAYPWPRRAAAPPPVQDDIVPEDEQGHFAAAEVSLRLRRADRHPDAPAREPIFASRDLGSPFMEVGAFAPPPELAEPAAEHVIPDGDYAEIDEPAAVPEEDAEPAPVIEAEPDPVDQAPEAAHETIEVAHHDEPVSPAEHEWPIPHMPGSIAAFAPEDEPAPAPMRTPRESIAAMMDRLSAGLERRAAHGDGGVPPATRQPALRDALDELNRLAARRG